MQDLLVVFVKWGLQEAGAWSFLSLHITLASCRASFKRSMSMSFWKLTFLTSLPAFAIELRRLSSRRPRPGLGMAILCARSVTILTGICQVFVAVAPTMFVTW